MAGSVEDAMGILGAALEPTEREALRRAYEARGRVALLADLGLDYGTLSRAIGGMGLRKGTIVMVRTYLAAHPDPSPAELGSHRVAS